MDSKLNLIDLISAYYASQGEPKCASLNKLSFSEGMQRLTNTGRLHQDLIQLSERIRTTAAGPFPGIMAHVERMLRIEKGSDGLSNYHVTYFYHATGMDGPSVYDHGVVQAKGGDEAIEQVLNLNYSKSYGKDKEFIRSCLSARKVK